MKSEADVKKEVRKILDAMPNTWYFMPSANGYGTPGIPDFVGSFQGSCFTIETKFGRGTQTAWQKKQEKLIVESGAPYLLIDEANVQHMVRLLGVSLGILC